MNFFTNELARLKKSSLAHNAIWMLAGQGANVLLQVGYFAVVGRLLGSVQYGIFIGAFALTNLVSGYSALGSGTLLLRHVSGDKTLFAMYWGNVLLTTLCVGGSLIFVTRLIAPHMINASSAALILLSGIANCFCGELSRNAAMVFQAYEKMRLTAVLNFVTSLTRLIAAVGLMITIHHATAWQWALATAIVSALAALLSVAVVTAHYGWPVFSIRLLIKGIPEGFGYSFASSTSVVYNDVDKTMLSHYGMNAANGIYALAYRVIDIATIPVLAIREAAVPRLFRDGTKNLANIRTLTLSLTKRALLVSTVLSMLLYLTAPLIPLLVGRSFADTVPAVRWLCLIPILRSIHQMSGNAVMGMGKQSYRTAAQLLVAAFNFGINIYLIPRYGWRGAAGSSLLSDAMLACLNWAAFLYLSGVKK